MKKSIFVVVFVSALLLIGCATSQNVTLKNDEQTVYTSSHKGIFPGPDNAISAASAEAIIITAKAEAEMIKGYSQGTGGIGEAMVKYCLVATNLTNKVAYIYHPELGRDFQLTTGNGYKFLYLSSIPERMIFKNGQGVIIWEPSPDREKMKIKKNFRGREVDLIINLTSQ